MCAAIYHYDLRVVLRPMPFSRSLSVESVMKINGHDMMNIKRPWIELKDEPVIER